MAEENKFAKLGIIYAIGQVLSKLISFILMPIYIKQLGICGFGQLALVDTILDFIASFTIVGIYSGYIRFYRDYDNQQTRLKNTALSFAFVMSVLNIALAITLGKFVSSFIINIHNSHYILVLIIVRSAVSQLVILLMCDYGLNYKAKINVALNLVNLLMNLGFTILLVVKVKRGIAGIYEGYILSNVIMFIYLMIVKDSKYRFEIDRDMLKDMLRFSAGLIPSCVASTVLTLSDRYFLKGYRSVCETGIYSVGYKFGMLIQPLFVSPFNQVFTPYKFSIWRDEDAEEKFNGMFQKYHIIGCFIMLGICIYSKPMIFLLSTAESVVAYKLVPLIVLAYFLYGKSSFYCLGIQIRNKTYYDGLIMLMAGGINILLNILFIPKLGMYGAALATAISYVAMNFIYVRFSLPLYPVKYKRKNIIKIYFITLILYLTYYAVSLLHICILLEMTAGAILLLGYIAFSVYFNLITSDELIKYVKKIKVLMNKR